MKNILVVSGSARKNGNTMSMVKIIQEEMERLDTDVAFEYLYLIDQKLDYCIGCSICLRKGGHNCPLKDDKEMILEKMIQADGIIFASPGYAGMVSGMFKNFIDRFMYQDHIPEFVGKPTLIVSTSGGDGVMGAPKYMANCSFYWWGCHVVDIIGIGHAFYTVHHKSKLKYTRRLKAAAKKLLVAAIDKPLSKPNFRQYIYFMFNKTELEISPTVMPYRTDVWREKGWMDMNYYYDTKINPFYIVFTKIAFGLMKLVYKNLLGKDADKALADYVQNN
ncbi:MAG: NAD(P)H-dependent oxidoreductase [Clostridiales bacterium]|nr:NAD(P)H-dependent oxidoreductase [Clostridiales bacterium]